MKNTLPETSDAVERAKPDIASVLNSNTAQWSEG
jgi:hypothetical protein